MEEASKSYGLSEYDFQKWLELSGNDRGTGVHPSDVPDLVNKSGIFKSQGIPASELNGSNVSYLTDALSNGKRVLVGFQSGEGSYHMVGVRKIKVWSSGKFRIWFTQTSPVRIAPYSTNTLRFGYQGSRGRYYSFYK